VAIKRFRHRGIERLFSTGDLSGVQPKHANRLRLILGRLNAATTAQDMNLPGLKLHPLRAARKVTYAVSVSEKWRVTFAFAGKDVVDVDYEDYH
jgi:toxin HigB-1